MRDPIGFAYTGEILMLQMRRFILLLAIQSILTGLIAAGGAGAAELPRVEEVELQPLLAATVRLVEALDVVGAPLPAATKGALQAAGKGGDARHGIAAIESVESIQSIPPRLTARTSGSNAGSSRRSATGSPAITTSTPPAARTMKIPPPASARPT